VLARASHKPRGPAPHRHTAPHVRRRARIPREAALSKWAARARPSRPFRSSGASASALSLAPGKAGASFERGRVVARSRGAGARAASVHLSGAAADHARAGLLRNSSVWSPKRE
jgi:hypothetical protein